MNLPLLLAQAGAPGPVVITQDASFAWPVVIFLVGLAAAVGESRWRMSRAEKDAEEDRKAAADAMKELRSDMEKDFAALEAKHSETARKASETKEQVAVMANTLGRIEKGQETMERLLREALATRSP